jgi:hypothetical protein
VEPFGQELLSERVRAELARTTSLLRWLPDLAVMGSPHGLVLVDAKSATEGHRNSSNYSIEMRSILAGEMTELGVIYVFHDFHYIAVKHVRDVIARACCRGCKSAFDQRRLDLLPRYCPIYLPRQSPTCSATPFVLVPKASCRHLDVALPPIKRLKQTG